MTEAPSIWWYGVNSLFAPRTAARRLLDDKRLPGIAHRVAALGLAALFAASLAINAIADVLMPDLMATVPPLAGSGFGGRLAEAIGYAAVTLASVMVSYLLWIKLLGYRLPVHGVLVATALSLAVMLLLSPLQEALYIAVAGADDWVGLLALFVNFLAILGLSSFYYAEALGLSIVRAFSLNTLVVLLSVIWLAVAFFVLSFLLWALAGPALTPWANG